MTNSEGANNAGGNSESGNAERAPQEAFVWIWLPNETEPVVAGKLTKSDVGLVFNYGQSYLRRKNAIPIYEPELPLQSGVIPLLPGLMMPGCIRDGSPDAWGRRVIINRKLGITGCQGDDAQFDELRYLLESGSDRAGALDFQHSAVTYRHRGSETASLEQLVDAADHIDQGRLLSSDLIQALQHGTSIGGARPKAQIHFQHQKFIAKFSSSRDLFSVVKAEFIAMRLADLAGLDVAKVTLTSSMQKDVLLVERFDRVRAEQGWLRKPMVSALTVLALDEMMARYASYEDLGEIIRHRFTNAADTLREIFARLVFNVLCGNTDDHARNHAAFWNDGALSLTPAYDICPQGRTGREASQAMLIVGDDRMSRISTCLRAAPKFLISNEEAVGIVAHQIDCIAAHWEVVCASAKLGDADRALLWGRQFLNPYAFEDLQGDAAHLKAMAHRIRGF